MVATTTTDTKETQIQPQHAEQVRIAIQGGAGAFHEIAARRYQQLGQLEIVPADTFEELIEKAQNPKVADGGIMAIENSIYGSIIPNYNLIRNSKLKIIGEVFLRIKQNLIVIKGQTLDQLTEVYSHPVAIVQCQPFFKKNYPNIRLIEQEDTALSAKMVRDKGMKHAGAIASTLAAEMYEMEIIAEGIETNTQNYTRFLILATEEKAQEQTYFNKVSVSFTLSHEVGSLHKVLATLAAFNANLTKIQSAPIMGTPWKYRFYMDFLVEYPSDFYRLEELLPPLMEDFVVLGKYQKGKHHEH